VGYIRVSSLDQNTHRQLDVHQLDRVFTDRLSGKDASRAELAAMSRYDLAARAPASGRDVRKLPTPRHPYVIAGGRDREAVPLGPFRDV
jgi:hypothetical protein